MSLGSGENPMLSASEPFNGTSILQAGLPSDEKMSEDTSFITSLLDKTTSTVSYTTTLQVGNGDGGNNTVLIVGVSCGVIGLFIGIAIAAIFYWVFRRRSKPAVINRTRHASVLEKNPKEKTFEPLDLSLTLPAYETQNSTISDKRKNLNKVAETNELPPKLDGKFSDLSDENNSSYQGFDPPSPPYSKMYDSHQTFHVSRSNEEQLRKLSDKREIHLHESYCTDVTIDKGDNPGMIEHRVDKIDRNFIRFSNEFAQAKRPTSIATRDSFSSGLGTGTESDTLPYESRKHSLPLTYAVGRDRADRTYPYDLPIIDKPRYTRRKSALGVVKESNGRRTKKSASGNQKKRPVRVSDASSGTASVHECSSTDTSCSPASTLTSAAESGILFSTPLTSTAPTISEEESGMHQKEWESSDTSEEEDWPEERDEMRIETQEKDANDLVSTYFNMHFPPTPMQLKKTQTNLNHTENDLRPVTLVRHSSDLTIDL